MFFVYGNGNFQTEHGGKRVTPFFVPKHVFVAFLFCLAWLFNGCSNAALEDQPSKVVCFGDSITKSGYPDFLGRLIGVEAIDAGVPGNNSREGLRRIERDVLSHQPEVVVIFFGTNDLRADAPHKYVLLDEYRANLQTMIKACRKQNAKVVLCTLPPIKEKAFFTRHDKPKFDAEGGLKQMMARYRETAEQVAEQADVPLVDLNQLLKEEPFWMSKDGVHPSPEGNAIIARYVARAVRPLLAKSANSTKPVADSVQSDGKTRQSAITIYGGTSAGVIAAVQASRMGKSVTLIEPRDHIGGLTTGGLGATDIGNKDVIGGLSREFYHRVALHYQDDESWLHETREEFFEHRSKRTKLAEVLGGDATMWTFTPQKLDYQLLRQLLWAEDQVLVRRKVSAKQ